MTVEEYSRQRMIQAFHNPEEKVRRLKSKVDVRIKFTGTKDQFRQYKDIVAHNFASGDDFYYIEDELGTIHVFNKEFIQEVKIWPQLEEVKEEKEDEVNA